MLRATTACNFSSLIWPAGSAPAALASLLSTLRSPKSLEKHSVSRLSYLFAHLHLLSSYSFSSTFLSSNLSLLSASSLLCFSSVHIVGSLTSKLPSIIAIPCGSCVHKHALVVRGFDTSLYPGQAGRGAHEGGSKTAAIEPAIHRGHRHSKASTSWTMWRMGI